MLAAAGTASVETVFGQTFGAGCVAVFLINWLKNASWFPLLQKEWKTAQRVWSVVLAAGAAMGVHVLFQGGTLTISGLSLTAIFVAGWAWIKAFAMQEFLYQATKQQEAAKPPAAAMMGAAVELAEPAPRPMPAGAAPGAPAKASDEATRGEADHFARKVRGPSAFGPDTVLS